MTDPDPQGAGPVRPLRREDRGPLARIVEETGFFTEDELAIALELIDAVLNDPEQHDYLINVYDDGAVGGYYCVGPTPATAGTFDLYWIVVDQHRQGKGVGKTLLRHAEELLRARGGRLVIAETSSQPRYAPTRGFYTRTGYTELARIPGYYRPGDDLVIYGKYLS